MNKHNLFRLAALGLAAALVAGCGGGGGGGGGSDDALEAVPASASDSSRGLVRYLKELYDARTDAETRDPVSIERFDPVTPDDSEPESVS